MVLFRQILDKTAIYESQTVDKIENAENNEIKILLLPPDCLKSQKTLSTDNGGREILNKMRNSGMFSMSFTSAKMSQFQV